MILQTEKQSDLKEVSKKIIEFSKSHIYTFEGPIGVGKTTLIQALCQSLGITEKVTSPSYSIVNEYVNSDIHIYHFDFYRINEEEEAYDIGIEEYFYSNQICFIEWPEKIPNLLPDMYTKVHIKQEGEQRYYEIEAIH